MSTVRDGATRHLLVIAFSAYAAASGLAPLPGVVSEVEDVRAAFRELGYDDAHTRIWWDAAPGVLLTEVYDALAATGHDDVVALYVTGHGESRVTESGTRHYLHTAGSAAGRFRDAVTVDDLLKGLAEGGARRLLVLVDACEAGAGLGSAVTEARSWLPDPPSGRTSVSVVATARRSAPASVGTFAAAWRHGVESTRTARELPYLSLVDLLDAVARAMPGQPLDHMIWRATGADLALPNPRHHLSGIDPAEMRDWWEPRARADDAGRSWLFTGRAAVNERLARWCADHADAPVLVVTAAPGSGKSSVLARCIALTDPGLRRDHRRHVVPSDVVDTPPPGFRFAATVWAHRGSVDTIRSRLVAAVGGAADVDLGAIDPPTAGEPPVIAVDAVDEADEPFRLVAEVLAPLARSAERGALRLVVATRARPVGAERSGAQRRDPDLIRPLQVPRHEVVDIDLPRWLRQGDIADYADVLLGRPGRRGRPNPWARAPAARRKLARAIESAAAPSFLLAGMIARRHTFDTERVGPDHPTWNRQFPTAIGAALVEELEAAHGYIRAQRLLTVLRPLGYAQGAGLPREPVAGRDLWAVLAGALAPDEPAVTPAEIDALLADRTATHLVASLDVDGRPAYRLHHQALVDHFAGRGRASAAGHSRIVDALVRLVEGEGAIERAPANGYFNRALPGHAAACGRLSEIIADAGVLVVVNAERLYAVLRSRREPDLVTVRTLLGPLLHRLPAMSRPGRAVLLALAAAAIRRSGEPTAGLTALAQKDGGVAVLGVAIRPGGRGVSLTDRHPSADPVLGVVPRSEHDCVLVFADGPFLEVWSPDDLAQIALLADHDGDVRDLHAFRDTEDLPALASVDDRGRVQVRDLNLRGGPRFTATVDGFAPRAVTGRDVDGTVFLAVATVTGVRVFHPDTDHPSWDVPLADAHPVTALAVVSRAAGGDALAVGARDQVTVWEQGAPEPFAVMDVPGCLSPSLAGEHRRGVDGVLLVLDSFTGGLWYWRPGTEPAMLADDLHPTAAVVTTASPPRAAVGSLHGDVTLWDVDGGVVVRHLLRGSATINDVQVLPGQGELPGVVVAVDKFGELTAWDMDSGEWLITHRPPGQVAGLAVGRYADGDPFAASVGDVGVVLWEIAPTALQVAPDLHPGRVTDMVVHDDHGDVVVVTLGEEGGIRLWDGRTGDLLTVRQVPPDDAATMVLRAGPEGLRCTVGTLDGLVDVALSGPRSSFVLPVKPIVAMADVVLPDGHHVVALALPGRIRLHDIDSGGFLVEFDNPDRAVQRLACHALGAAVLIVAGCDFGVVRTWRWSPGARAGGDEWSSGEATGWRGPVTLLATSADDAGRLHMIAGGPGGALLVSEIDHSTGELGPPRVLLDMPGARVTAVGATTDGFVAAVEDVAGEAALHRWRPGWSPDGHVVHPLPVRGLAGTVRVRRRRWAVGWSTAELVLVPLTGALQVYAVPLPAAPELVRVHDDKIFVAAPGGFLGLKVTGIKTEARPHRRRP